MDNRPPSNNPLQRSGLDKVLGRGRGGVRRTPMRVIRPLTDAEYAAWKQDTIPSYAHEKVKSGAWDQAGALEKTRQEFESVLPGGKDTKDNHLFAVVATDDTQVGVLWFAVKDRATARVAYIYNIEISPEHQRKGHAERALRALEGEVESLGLQGTALHVFGHNKAAQALYTKLGYLPTDISMYKAVPTGA